jgi:hypothetical protein
LTEYTLEDEKPLDIPLVRINGPGLEPLHALFVMLWQKEEWVGEVKIPGIYIYIYIYMYECIYVYVRHALVERGVGEGSQNTRYPMTLLIFTPLTLPPEP